MVSKVKSMYKVRYSDGSDLDRFGLITLEGRANSILGGSKHYLSPGSRSSHAPFTDEFLDILEGELGGLCAVVINYDEEQGIVTGSVTVYKDADVLAQDEFEKDKQNFGMIARKLLTRNFSKVAGYVSKGL